jgi:AcrR family transcriptional regulator
VVPAPPARWVTLKSAAVGRARRRQTVAKEEEASVPRSPLDEQQLATFRVRVVAVAMQLFAERGYEAVTMRAIADELGVSPMTPYRYFANKADIVRAVRADAYDQMAQALDQVPTDLAAQQRVFAIGRAMIAFAVQHPHAYRHMFELGHHDGPPAAGAGRAWHHLAHAVTDAIDQGLLVGDPLTVAHLFWSAVHGLIALQLAGKLVIGRSLDDLIEPALQAAWRGHTPAAIP